VDPYADAFWRRDLSQLVGLLADSAGPEEAEARALFGDLVRLVNCEPLPALPDEGGVPARELRLLVRLELARRVRLGESAKTAPTLWRDILSPAFFNRELGDKDGSLLIWPIEEERWPHEEVRARVRPSACGGKLPAGVPAELSIASTELLAKLRLWALQQARLRPSATRLAYHRAVLLYREGRRAEAAEAARLIDQPDESGAAFARHARLLRLELGLEPPAGYLALAEEDFGPNQPAVDLRLAYGYHHQGDWTLLRALTAEIRELPVETLCGKGTSPLRRDLFYRHAVALERLGMTAALDEALDHLFPACARVAEPSTDALRALAVGASAGRPLDPRLAQRLTALGPPQHGHRFVAQYGSRALRRGNLTGAQAAVAWLLEQRDLSAQTRGWALEAEIAFSVQDPRRFDQAVSRMFPREALVYVKQRDREERDRAAVELTQALVTSADDRATSDFRRQLRAQLAVIRDGAALKREASFNVLLGALEGKPVTLVEKGRQPAAPVAVGEIPVSSPWEVLPPPPVHVEWPEPYSLLAIPPPPESASGALRAWFDPAVEVSDAKE
jgi:hypothetical protein